MTKTKKFLKNIEAKALPYTVLFLLITVTFSGLFLVLPPEDKLVRAASTTDFTSYKNITLNSSQVPSTLTNFPVLINLSSDADLASDALDSGYDIAFFNGTGAGATQYNHEIELFNGTTGRLVAWVNVTTLSSSSDTTIYMYYNDSDIGSSAENVTGTWSGYDAVWHLGEESGTRYDSSANDYDWTGSSNSPTSVTGIAGNGTRFVRGGGAEGDGSTRLNQASARNFGSVHTISFWIKFENLTADYGDIVSDDGSKIIDERYVNGNYFVHYSYNPDSSTQIRPENNTYGADEWIHMVFVRDSDVSGKVFFNGINQTRLWVPGDNRPCLIEYMGSYYDTHYGVNAIIDAWKISKTVHSDDWVLTEYNNVNNATDGGFFSLGEQDDTSGTYEISGLVDSDFDFSGEANTTVWSTGNETMSIHTNLSGTSENCTDIFIDLKDGIDADIDEEAFVLVSIRSSDGSWASVSSVLTVTDGGNMTINETTWDNGVSAGWAHGTNPFPIDNTNATIDVRMRVTIPAGKSTGTYSASDWEVVWKTIS